jgi:TolB-like protein
MRKSRIVPRLSRLARRRRLLFGAAAAAVLAAVVGFAQSRRPQQPAIAVARVETTDRACPAQTGSAAEAPGLIVLPLKNFTDDPRLALFAEAATERVQSALALIPGAAIIAGPPPGHPDLGLSAADLADKNGATHLLEGGLRATASQLQASLRLIEARSGRELWQSTTRLPLPLTDPVAAQDQIALAAAEGVQERLTDGRQALAYRRYGPASVEVWEANTRGTADLNTLDPAANERARSEFNTALALDPKNAGASTGLAYAALTPVVFGWTADAAAGLADARARAEAALAIDPDHPGALSALSLVSLFEGDREAALELGERAVRSSGGGADATAILAYVMSYTNDTARSLDLARRAARARPYTSPLWYRWNLARALRLHGDLEAAIGCLAAITEGYPTAAAPALELIQAYDAAGRPQDARPLARAVLGGTSGPFSSAGYCARPAYADTRRTAVCTAALTRAGLPE